jgi:hypothetical protein
MKVIVASVISLLFCATASAQDEPTFDFPKLTSANFDAMTDGKTVLLMCYAPWVRGVHRCRFAHPSSDVSVARIATSADTASP